MSLGGFHWGRQRFVRPRKAAPKPVAPKKPRAAPPSPKLDTFAELIAENVSVQDAAAQMGITLKAGRKLLERLQRKYGEQAR